MGEPWFKMRDMAKQHGIVALSSNYELYADMSNRMMSVLAAFSPDQEIYSIDECFLGLEGFDSYNLTEYGQQMRQRVNRWVGLPVCVGIAGTKTLAKLANHCAKKGLAGADGVCDFTRMNIQKFSDLLACIDISEIWGVGRRLSEQLKNRGISSVEDLRKADTKTLRREFSVVMERIVMELNGTPCIELEEGVPNKQQIISSRSFGSYVRELQGLEEAVATYIARAAVKLRGQASVAGMVQVYIRTNPHKASAPQYQKGVTVPLSIATDDTLRLTQAALWALKGIYRPGYDYQKAGVALLNLSPKVSAQTDLFTCPRDNAKLMATMDRINAIWGRGTLRSATEGKNKSWSMKREIKSPCFTSDWNDLLKIS